MSQIISIAICDDEKIQVDLLKKYVNNWAGKNNLRVDIEYFYSGESFEFNWSMNNKYSILLLDIEMAGINGVDLAKKIREEDNLLNIVFITAIPDYIGEGYEVDAINYLIKPIEESQLHKCLDKSMEKVRMEEKTLLIDVEGKIIKIKEKNIVYVEAFSHSIDIYTIDGKYTTRKNIGVIEKELDEKKFIRCHRSYIVGLKHIKKIGKTDIELDNEDTIPVSRRLYSKVNIGFIRYFRGEVDE